MTRIGRNFPTLHAAVSTAVEPSRATIAHDLFTSSFALTSDLVPHARDLIWAAGTTRDGPDTEGLVPPVAGLLALRGLVSLPSVARALVEGRLSCIESPAQRAVLLKVIGAHAALADDLPALIDDVASQIRDDDLQTLIHKTTVYDRVNAPGLRQAFPMSCGPAMTLTMHGEADPLLALRLGVDAALGPRLQREAMIDPNRQQPLGESLAQAFAPLGIGYTLFGWEGTLPDYKSARLDDLFRIVRAGGDVGLLMHDGTDGHYAALVDCKILNGQRAWRIHDPALGSRWTSDTAFLDGEAVYEGRRLVSLWVPS